MPNVAMISLDAIYPPEWRLLPCNTEAHRELIKSIQARGVLNALTVADRGNRFILINGVYRWDAAKQAGLKEVPCVIHEVTDDEIRMYWAMSSAPRKYQ